MSLPEAPGAPARRRAAEDPSRPTATLVDLDGDPRGGPHPGRVQEADRRQALAEAVAVALVRDPGAGDGRGPILDVDVLTDRLWEQGVRPAGGGQQQSTVRRVVAVTAAALSVVVTLVAAATAMVFIMLVAVFGWDAAVEEWEAAFDELTPGAAVAAPAGAAGEVVDPMACRITHTGDPLDPGSVTLNCLEVDFEASGLWDDSGVREFSPSGDGWTVTSVVLVTGSARIWYQDDDLDCLAIEDLLTSTTDTTVECAPREEPDDGEVPPAPEVDPGPLVVVA